MGKKMDSLFGRSVTKSARYVRSNGRIVMETATVECLKARVANLMAADAYNGGRTETFLTGPLAAPAGPDGERPLYDIDLRSAYPTSMAAIGVPIWDDLTFCGEDTDPSSIRAEALGYFEVTFDCPSDLRYPPFGIKTPYDLVFPMRGTTYATAAEIATAVHLGVNVTIKFGVIVGCDRSVRPFADFAARTIAMRNERKVGGRDTLESKVIKEVTNSLYGKSAQGIKERRGFDPATGCSRRMPPSAVTSAAIAAFTTGLPRACMCEILNSVAASEVVGNVATDGCLTSARPSDLDLSGPAARVMAEARRRIVGDAAPADDVELLLEVKKVAREVVLMRNRGAATTEASPGSEPVLARNSIKFDRGDDANAALLELYFKRTPNQKRKRSDFISPRAQVLNRADLVKIEKEVTLGLEPDAKRRMVEAEMIKVRHGAHAGTEHLATRSVPHETVEAALDYRAAYEAWRRGGGGRVLKTMEDWRSLQEHLALREARQALGKRGRGPKGNAVGLLVQQLLRAATHGDWGFSMDGDTQAGLAGWLSEQPAVAALGAPVAPSAVKNASRNGLKPTEGCVPAVPGAIDMARALAARFPGGEVLRFFAPGDREAVAAALAAGGAA